MARYVVLEFDNDTDADAFVSTINHGGPSAAGTVRAIGMYQKPTQFCDCPGNNDTSVRGAKHGWWLHKPCAKPKRGHMQHPVNKLRPEVSLSHQVREMYLGVREPLAKREAAHAETV